MSEQPTSVEVETTGPNYLGWRAEVLARLALARRVPGLTVFARGDRAPAEFAHDFLVATEQGFCFFVEARAFSSFHLDIADPAAVEELRWAIDADTVRRARASRSPVLLFLFDADTDHGRYLRLDTLPAPDAKAKSIPVRLPRESTLTRETLASLIGALEERTRPAPDGSC